MDTNLRAGGKLGAESIRRKVLGSGAGSSGAEFKHSHDGIYGREGGEGESVV